MVLAAVEILEYGWKQGGLGDKSLGFCVIGALDEVYNRENPPYGVRNKAIEVLEHMVGMEPIHKWNDYHGYQALVVDYLMRGAEESELWIGR